MMAGFAAGWWVWPVQYTNTAPDALHQSYRDQYVLMTATAFEADGDFTRAVERLRTIAPEAPTFPVVRLAEQLIEEDAGPDEIARLARLAQALGSLPSTLAPYLEGAP
jgi:hypothetical protein